MRTLNRIAQFILIFVLFFSLVDTAFAKEIVEISGEENLFVQCRFCEVETSDCRSKPSVFVRSLAKDPWIGFDTFSRREVARLKSKLEKARTKSPAKIKKNSIKKALARLRERYSALKKRLEMRCRLEGIVEGDTGSGNDSETVVTELGQVNGYKGIILASTRFHNTFATAISEQGQISGGGYGRIGGEEVSRDTNTGIQVDLVQKKAIVPIIWDKRNRGVTGCKELECPKGLVLSDINSSGFAVGTQRSAAPDASMAWSFQVDGAVLKTLSSAPSSSSCANLVTDTGMTLGAAPCNLSKLDTKRNQNVVWSGALVAQLNENELLSLYLAEAKSAALESIKSDLITRNDSLECSLEEISRTQITGEGSILSQPSIQSTGINDKGEVVGFVRDGGITWEYTGPCLTSSFTGLGRSVYAISDGRIKMYETHVFSAASALRDEIPLVINNSGVVLGLSIDVISGGLSPLFLSLNEVSPKWRSIATSQIRSSFVIGNRINNSGHIVGNYYEAAPAGATRAFAKINLQAFDLNSLVPPNSDWTLEFAADINDCGEIVGRAYNSAKNQHGMFLLSPQGCR